MTTLNPNEIQEINKLEHEDESNFKEVYNKLEKIDSAVSDLLKN